MNEGTLYASMFSAIYNTTVSLSIPLDNRDLFISLSTHSKRVNKSIRCDCNVKRREFERPFIAETAWIHDNSNLVERGAKSDGPPYRRFASHDGM